MGGGHKAMDFEDGVAAVRAFVRREAERLAAATAARTARLQGLVPVISAALREAGASRVWVFGSMAQRSGWSTPHPESDLDLAVEGLTREGLLGVERIVLRLAGEPVDLLRLEDAPASLRDRIIADAELAT